ncbi:hypothetical protein [Micromonospora peucetia]|uniref:Uncharacterized protein n=1 Tax=Micromonospora peucetia TaxID=47871 RepID=A0A1C6VL76_9ACTN|nr:hypothetical protein [Micromonospora peucetia]SCL66987.1 hypothetical protein GA0070608_3413 [Micromonospora peucetia]
MVSGTSSTQFHRPRATPAAARSKGSRAGVAVAVTVGGPVGVFAAGFGMARDAQLTAWLLLALLITASGYGIVRLVLRSVAGSR